jgi:protein-L-isoaspartate O-methyltransferase
MAIDLEDTHERMVLEQFERRGIEDLRMLAAMRSVTRHRHRAARPIKRESWLN